MAALSLMGFSLPDGLTLSKTVNGNMTSNVVLSGNSKHEATNASKTFSKITVQNVLSENIGNNINISNNGNGNGHSSNGNNSNSTMNVNGGNAIVRKIKDFGMVGAVNNAAGSNSKSLISRKRPLMESKKNIGDTKQQTMKATTPATKKLKQAKESATPKSVKKSTISNENVQRSSKKVVSNLATTNLQGLNPKPAGTPGRKGLPLPQAVARRNARERNRVKQVNNGFAALRERIPEEVAEVFETQSPASGRGNSAKKLSKVETLRMAVEYIRSLERLLGFDFSMTADGGGLNPSANSSGEDSYTLIKDEFDTLSPSLDENFDDSLSHYDMDDYFNNNNNNNSNELQHANLSTPTTDLLPDITTLNGLQYIRIPGTNTYQLLTPDIFVGSTQSPPNSSLDDDQFNAIIDGNCMSPTAPAAVGYKTSTINANNPATSMTSPAAALIAAAHYTLSARLSPVPTQMQPSTSTPPSTTSSTSSTTSSPDAGSSSSLHQHQQQHQHATLTLSPATINEHRTAQSSCAATLTATTTTTTTPLNIAVQERQFIAPTLPHLLTHFIKEEFVGDQLIDYAATKKSPSGVFLQTTTSAGDQHASLSLSPTPPPPPPLPLPALDRCGNRLLIAPHHQHQHQQHHLSGNGAVELQSFYEQDDSGSFYDNNLSFKKEFNDVLLDASTATNTALSDESMIEAIDWWEAHTPQSEGGGGGGNCAGSFALS